MRRLGQLSVVLVLGAMSVLLGPVSPACACDCAVTTSEEMLGLAEVAFTGKVVDVDRPVVSFSSTDPVRVTFDVDTVYKGKVPDDVVVVTERDGASCGYLFGEGHSYLVFASTSGEDLRTGMCSGNLDLAVAANPLTGGSAPGPAEGGHTPRWVAPTAFGTGMLIVVGALFWWLSRRQKKAVAQKSA